MKRIATFLFALTCFSACSKRNAGNPSDSNLTVNIDPTLGLVTSRSSDTFIVSLKHPMMVNAVPLTYTINSDAKVSSGSRKKGVWTDTVNLSPATVLNLTVTSGNGQSSKYVVAYEYVYEYISLPLLKSGSYATDICRGGGDTVFVATNEGLLLSADGGHTFTDLAGVLPAALPSWDAASVAVNRVFVQGGKIYAATYYGLSVSTNGGKSFTYSNGAGSFSVLYSVAAQGDTIYAGTDKGIAISRNNGVSFDATSLANPNQSFNSIHAIYAQGEDIYVGGDLDIYISHDGGRTFSDARSKLVFPTGAGPDVFDIYPDGGKISLGTSAGTAITADGGESYSVYPDYENIWWRVRSNDNWICAATTSGPAISRDGGQSYQFLLEEDGGVAYRSMAAALRGKQAYFSYGNAGQPQSATLLIVTPR